MVKSQGVPKLRSGIESIKISSKSYFVIYTIYFSQNNQEVSFEGHY